MTPSESTLLEMRGVRKTFGSVVALDNVTLNVKRGEIHGLLGGNGAGKTTLMNVLFGLYKADAGEIAVDGRVTQVRSPREAIGLGIGMVHQQFLQVNSFSAAENIVLGTPLSNRPTLDLTIPKQKIRALSEKFGLLLDPDATLESLPMGARQRVEILKALYRDAKLLILDEPTTMLTPQQVDSLFNSLRAMVKSGLSVIFITHKLREVLTLCERITVLRNGKSVITLAREEATEDTFIKAMVGEEMNIGQSLLFAKSGYEAEIAQVGSKELLKVDGLSVEAASEENQAISDLSFTIREGEILGVAGVAGNGQHELAESLMRIRPCKGKVIFDGAEMTVLATRDLLARGIAYVPENRWDDGLLPKATVAQNLILGSHRNLPYSNGLMLNLGAILKRSQELIDEFKIKTESPHALAANLSGGNVQRMMLARAFSQNPKLMIVHNPTQGLDIPSTEFVYNKLLERKRTGMATLLISENLDELFLMCNRVAAIYRGRIVGVLERGQFDAYRVGRMMSGLEQ